MQFDNDYELTCLDSARSRARQKKLTEATDKQLGMILLCMKFADKTSSDFNLSLENQQAILTKIKANELIADMAVEAIFNESAVYDA